MFDFVLGRVSQDALAELKALGNIIQSSIQQIEEAVTANSFIYPSPDSTFSPESEAPRMHPAIQSAASLIISAAAQLMTRVRPAPLTLLDISSQVCVIVPPIWIVIDAFGMLKFNVSTAVRTALSTHVAEILRDAGPKVILMPNHSLEFEAVHDLCRVGKTCVGNRSAHEGSPRKIR